MTNKEIASTLKLAANLMELHNENPFKVKSYTNAAYNLGKFDTPLNGLDLDAMSKVNGIGKSLAQKITELLTTGNISELQELIDKTPLGVIEFFKIKGLGPKKIAMLWQEVGMESIGELEYACNENRLKDIKGFGAKTQEEILKAIQFLNSNQNKFHYASAEDLYKKIETEFLKVNPNHLISVAGELRRKNEIINELIILVEEGYKFDFSIYQDSYRIPINIIETTKEGFYNQLFEQTGPAEFVSKLTHSKNYSSEEEMFSDNKLPFIIPELRDWEKITEMDSVRIQKNLIELKDLKGVLHWHTTYSDGTYSLKEMTEEAIAMGLEYAGVCDHSRTASYAGGLDIERVAQQNREIDKLNEMYPDFTLLKGIESDILPDGSLDYPEDILQTFDFIVASVHANLKMDPDKATARLIKAIENPYTTILGHPTGRLLLSREGYQPDMYKIIDACAANEVAIELNAHPYRLDIDWRYIPYAMEKEVMISINPDAHNKLGLHDMRYGVNTARKGMLNKDFTLNALDKEDFIYWLEKRR